jgi:hypothetical protein
MGAKIGSYGNEPVTYQGVLNMLNKCTPFSATLNKTGVGVSGNMICGRFEKTCLMTYVHPVASDDTISITSAIQDIKPIECSFMNFGDFETNKNYMSIDIIAICCSP